MTATASRAKSFRALRMAAGLTVMDVAVRIGATYPAVHTWENGRSFPRAEQIPALAELLRVTEGEVIASIGKAAAMRAYVCPVCGYGKHVLDAAFCKICGAKIALPENAASSREAGSREAVSG